MLSGHSTIYGETAIPIASIQELNLDNFEREGFNRPFNEWVIHPAKETRVRRKFAFVSLALIGGTDETRKAVPTIVASQCL